MKALLGAFLFLATLSASQAASTKSFNPATQCGRQEQGAAPRNVQATHRKLTPEQLRADLTLVSQVLMRCDPDLHHSVPPSLVAAKIAAIRSKLDHPMTREEAWRVFSTLNPVLADGHLGIFHANSSHVHWLDHVNDGGVLFPFETVAHANGMLYVRAMLGGGETPLAGARIVSIDGVSASNVIATAMKHVNGDTPRFRAHLLSRRFWSYYWSLYGSPKSYHFVLEHHGQRLAITVPGSVQTPVDNLVGKAFNHTFAFQLLPHKAALLTIKQFYWPHRKRYLAFMRSAFARMKEAGTRTLIIDVRDNGGGDDGFWKNGILPYIGHGKYLFASSYVKRELPGHTDAGYKIGDVAKGKLDSWVTLDAHHPLHFSGKVYVLEGGMTYSSSILFINVMQHFGYATIAGEGGVVRANQSGGVYSKLLPNTVLIVSWPRFILIRPSGATKPEFLQPDIAITSDPLHPMAAVRKVLRVAERR
ncbi:S41 family peptidase [Oleiagrimonas sp. C23AA]|uniref:S41 family peptidase n=1 Tax=Oleiagrimonas sp. C23AA TaxID=2719047 RepID=UPI0014227AD9|nr:S41 family peptidase [Oleiagrimonas sp. C23AA]NII11057.1 hypothetical protein [Oleiagrimonas sp. C23AA]